MKWKVVLILALFVACLLAGRRGGSGDFERTFEVAHYSCNGEYSRIYDLQASLPYFYSPVGPILSRPLCYFPSFKSAIVSNLIFHSLSFLVFWICLFALFPKMGSWGALGWLLVWGSTINPLQADFMGQNIQLPLATALLASEWMTRQKNRTLQVVAGVLVALSATLKLFPVLVVVFYVLVKPRLTKVGVVVGLAIGLLLPFLYYGPATALDLYQGFFHNLTRYHQKNSLVENLGILCLPSLLATWIKPWFPTTSPGPLILVAQVVIAGWFFLSVLRRKSKFTARESLHYWSLCLALTAFLNPSSRQEYFILYVPAFCSLVEKWQLDQLKVNLRTGLFASFCLIGFTTKTFLGQYWNNTLHGWRVPVIGMALLCLTLGVALRFSRRFHHAG